MRYPTLRPLSCLTLNQQWCSHLLFLHPIHVISPQKIKNCYISRPKGRSFPPLTRSIHFLFSNALIFSSNKSLSIFGWVLIFFPFWFHCASWLYANWDVKNLLFFVNFLFYFKFYFCFIFFINGFPGGVKFEVLGWMGWVSLHGKSQAKDCGLKHSCMGLKCIYI